MFFYYQNFAGVRYVSRNRLFCIFILSFHLIVKSFAQTGAIPHITNFSLDHFKIDSRNWAVTQGLDGNMYFGNHDGILEYTGVKWNLLLEPKNLMAVWSLHVDSKNRIFAGAQNEFAYAEKDKNGQFHYYTLNHLIPEQFKPFDYVLSIFESQGKTHFLASNRVYRYYNDQIDLLHPEMEWHFASHIKNDIYLFNKQNGIYKYKDNRLISIIKDSTLNNKEIKFITELPNKSLLIGSYNNGLYQYDKGKLEAWSTEIATYCKQLKINGCKRLSSGKYALYSDEGLVLFNSAGKLLFHVNKSNGLQSNVITGVWEDRSQNLWLSLLNGMAMLELNTPVTSLGKKNGIEGPIYDIKYINDKLYVASNQGLLLLENYDPETENLYDKKFRKIFDGICWHIDTLNKHLLLNHQQGLYEIHDTVVEKIKNTNGSWRVQDLSSYSKPNTLLQGTHEGFNVFEHKKGRYCFKNAVEGFDLRARLFTVDKDRAIWVMSSSEGIYRLWLDDELKKVTKTEFYDDQDGLPTKQYNIIVHLDDKIFFGTEFGLYTFNDEKKCFEHASEYKNIFNEKKLVRKVVRFDDERMLIVLGHSKTTEISYLESHDGFTHITSRRNMDFLSDEMLLPFENFLKINDKHILMGGKEELLIYDLQKSLESSTNFTCNITEAAFIKRNDSLLLGNYFYHAYDSLDHHSSDYGEHGIKLPFRLNAIRFSFASTYFLESNRNKYSTYLEGFDEDWTPWSRNTYREYTNLAAGEYILRVKAQNIHGAISETAIYKFEILAPWYLTIPMKIVYILLLLISGFLVFYTYKKRNLLKKTNFEKQHLKEMEDQEEKYKKELMKLESELIQVHYEDLKKKNEYKSLELSNAVNYAKELSSTVQLLKEKFINNEKAFKNNGETGAIEEQINEVIESNVNWENFELLVNQTHDGYLDRLLEICDDLNNREIRLCAYLRVGMSTKEIAPLMGISNRGVESLRYRLRKKFKLDRTEDLSEFVIRV